MDTTKITLSRLTNLSLQDLLELKSICSSCKVIVCDSIEEIRIWECPKLKRLPLSLPLLNGQLSPLPSVVAVVLCMHTTASPLNDIATIVHLDLSNVDDEKKRAAKLAQAVMRRQQSVLILDDMRVEGWVAKVGLQVKIKVEPFSKEEAWSLFLEKVGYGVALPPEVTDIARSVAKECAGLPLAITVPAGSMRGVDDICERRNTLEILKESKVGQDDMELREELIERFIGEGLIDRMKSRQVEFDRGHTILNELENSCLLEGIIEYFPHEKKCLKMHDLVRDMALQIVIMSPRFMVAAGVGLKDIPDEEKWTEDLEKVSLMHNKISEIPSSLSPRCPKLSTMMLQHNSLRTIPDSFFVHMHMHELKVIDLSYNCIEYFPNSLSNLENLMSLLLRECDKIEHVPSLAKLTALRRLDLVQTTISEVPNGLEMLVNLRYLDLYSPNLKMLPVGTFAKLSRSRKQVHKIVLEGFKHQSPSPSLNDVKKPEDLKLVMEGLQAKMEELQEDMNKAKQRNKISAKSVSGSEPLKKIQNEASKELHPPKMDKKRVFIHSWL
uniref:Disease resistance protein winged helix domain-containing protein n=1 Tax=Fagus sylvatica TaxID=28930 RepID=A0A2N9ETS5_FAGSY